MAHQVGTIPRGGRPLRLREPRPRRHRGTHPPRRCLDELHRAAIAPGLRDRGSRLRLSLASPGSRPRGLRFRVRRHAPAGRRGRGTCRETTGRDSLFSRHSTPARAGRDSTMTASSSTTPTGFRAFIARPAALRAAAWDGMARAAEGLACLGRLHGATAPRHRAAAQAGRDPGRGRTTTRRRGTRTGTTGPRAHSPTGSDRSPHLRPRAGGAISIGTLAPERRSGDGRRRMALSHEIATPGWGCHSSSCHRESGTVAAELRSADSGSPQEPKRNWSRARLSPGRLRVGCGRWRPCPLAGPVGPPSNPVGSSGIAAVAESADARRSGRREPRARGSSSLSSGTRRCVAQRARARGRDSRGGSSSLPHLIPAPVAEWPEAPGFQPGDRGSIPLWSSEVGAGSSTGERPVRNGKVAGANPAWSMTTQ